MELSIRELQVIKVAMANQYYRETNKRMKKDQEEVMNKIEQIIKEREDSMMKKTVAAMKG